MVMMRPRGTISCLVKSGPNLHRLVVDQWPMLYILPDTLYCPSIPPPPSEFFTRSNVQKRSGTPLFEGRLVLSSVVANHRGVVVLMLLNIPPHTRSTTLNEVDAV